MATDKTSKFFKIIIAILILGIIVALVIRFAGTLTLTDRIELNVDTLVGHDYSEQYKPSIKSVASGDMYYFKLENLNGAMIPSSSGRTTATYYSMDVVIATTNNKDAVALQTNSTAVADAIKDVMSGFSSESITNERGRNYLKQRIKDRVAQIVKIEDIDAIYFEKLIYKDVADY